MRVITVDRPGVGLSDLRPGGFLDWPDDVVELADALDLDRFAVLAWSGGGPFAAACAYRIPNRLTAAGIVAGMGPLDRAGATDGMPTRSRVGLRVAALLPAWAARLGGDSMARQCRRNPERFLEKQFLRHWPDADRAAAAHPDVRANVIAGTVESFRQGGRGMIRDGMLLARPWGFRLQDITAPVFLWYGDADVETPAHMGEHLARSIPNAKLIVYPGEGHMIFFTRWREILETLAGAA